MNQHVSYFGEDGKLKMPTPSELGFDPAEVRNRYASERDKRVRPEGARQYQAVSGDLDRYRDDPYQERLQREPVTLELDVAILGGGFGGMLMGARLDEAGIRNFRIVERAGDFGGTWYWNRYPGAQCDIESYIYLPLLEETGYMPTQKYVNGPEIFAHAQRIGKQFRLYDRALFQTQVTEIAWNEAAQRWLVTTDRGDAMHARHVVVSSGSLNRPKLPGLPGLRDFKGHTFHTSRWDYAYTGGSPVDPMDRLRDKRVGIIGTGATSLQAIPHLAAAAQHLYVFQRTPSMVDERGNRPTDPEWFKSLGPGWQAARNDNFMAMLVGAPVEQDLVDDGWTAIFKSLGELLDGSSGAKLTDEELKSLSEILDYRREHRIRTRIDQTVADPGTAERLKTWYRTWCKRPAFHDDFLPAFNRANVTLVDTQGKGVERLSESGVVVAGVEYPLDCLIFATGFEVSRATYTHQADLEIVGRNGVKLGTHWADGMRTFHGILAHGFPNCFHMGFTQTGFSANFTYMADKQSRHIASVIADAKERGIKTLEPTERAEADYVALVSSPNAMTEYLSTCTPGYYNAEGQSKRHNDGFIQGHYPEGGLAFYDMLSRWRANGDFAGLTTR